MGRRTSKYKKAAKRAAHFYDSDIFGEFLGLTGFLAAFLGVFLIFQDTITAVPLFNIIMTLGGLESYENTVFGLAIIFMLGGIILILENN